MTKNDMKEEDVKTYWIAENGAMLFKNFCGL